MKINIQTLMNKETLNFEGETMVSLEKMPLAHETTDYMTKVYGSITRDGDLYTVDGFVDVTLDLLCDRCMEIFKKELHAPLSCVFSSNPTIEEDEEIYPVMKSSIDLSEPVLQAVVMDFPMKVLCKEECKGMCKVCGANLNTKECLCDGTDIDPRLEQLKNIFSSQK